MAKPLKWLILTALLLMHICAFAQKDTIYSRDHLFQPQELHADLAFVKSVLEEAHPSLYRYTPKDTIDALFAGADKKLDSPRTAFQFWKILAPVVAGIRSAHTNVSIPARYWPWIGVKRDTIMPLFVFLRDNRIYAASFPLKTGKMQPGAEILAIDGHPAAEILRNLRSYSSPEGYNNQFIDFYLEKYTFGEYYNCFYGFKKQYDITYADSSGVAQHAALNNLQGAIVYWMKGVKPHFTTDTTQLGRDVTISTFTSVPSTVLLTIKSLTYQKDFREFDAYFFKKLQDDNTHNLIIDLRGNEGGFALLDFDMMRYLVKGKLVLKANKVLAATDEISFKKYLLPGSDPFTRPLTRIKKHVYESENDSHYGFVTSPAYHFDGKVYILIDKGTFSAAALLAANLRAQADVTIIGEESGGGNSGTDGFGFWNIRLPNTSLTLRLPQYWVLSTVTDKNTGHGVMPDIPIFPYIADRMKRRDVALNATLQMILTGNNK